MSNNNQTAAQRYREMMRLKEPETIDVKLPSGEVHTRVKQSSFAVIFEAGELPTAIAEKSVPAWEAQGVKVTPEQPAVAAETAITSEEKNVIKAYQARDRVLTNSIDPKLIGVDQVPQNENELSVGELAPDDLAYLYKYEASFGDAAVMAAMFPEGRTASPLASHSRKAVRGKTK